MEFRWLKSAAQITYDKGFTPAFYKEMGEVFKKHMDDYVPWDSTNPTNIHLSTMVQVRPIKHGEDGMPGANIVYSMKYAKAQYHGTWTSKKGKTVIVKNRDTTVHTKSTSFWDKACWTNEKKEITAEVNKLRKRNAK